MRVNQFLKSGRIEKVGYAILFVFILLCNYLTLRFVDDYQYVFSFATSERIDSFGDIIQSLIAHRQIMNGRLVAHFFVHLFCVLPMWVFDIINSLFFVTMIALISKVATESDSRNNLIPLAVFCALWLFEPVFGQVNFWIAGSCNYLWSAVFGFLFLRPYINEYIHTGQPKTPVIRSILFMLLSFVAGAYSESGSIAFIAMAACILFLVFNEHKQVPVHLLLALVIAFLGYVSIYLAPAQWNNKAASFSFAGLYDNILRSIKMYESFGILAVAYVVMLIVAYASRVERKRIMLSIVMVIGSLCANFILVFANWYHERSAMSACVLLITADAILMHGLFFDAKWKTTVACAVAVLLLMMPSSVMSGFIDIYYTNLSMQNREVYIYQCIEAGETDLVVPNIEASTKYTPLYGLRYLSTEETSTWPNGSMALYYGVSSIIGESPDNAQ